MVKYNTLISECEKGLQPMLNFNTLISGCEKGQKPNLQGLAATEKARS